MTPATAADPAPPAAPTYPPEVEAFCAAHGLRPYLDIAVGIAREVYPTMLGYTTEVEDDPESPRRWVALDVTVPPGILGDGRTTWEFSSRVGRAMPFAYRELIRLAAWTG